MTAQASTGLVQENQAFGRFLQKGKRQAGSYSQLLKLRINIMVVASAWCARILLR